MYWFLALQAATITGELMPTQLVSLEAGWNHAITINSIWRDVVVRFERHCARVCARGAVRVHFARVVLVPICRG